MNLNSFKPDWQERWTAKEAEVALKDFKFKGPGWYLTSGDTMLVVPWEADDVHPWKQVYPSEAFFMFYVYNHTEAAAAFNSIVNAPTRVDER